MEDHLNTMEDWDNEEGRILRVLGRGLLKEFPNPGRKGCPPSAVLKRIAGHEMPLSDAEKWLDHVVITRARAALVTVITLTFKLPIGRVFTGRGSRSRPGYCFRFSL
jgi:hypothetical protein